LKWDSQSAHVEWAELEQALPACQGTGIHVGYDRRFPAAIPDAATDSQRVSDVPIHRYNNVPRMTKYAMLK
jgi:hypothetical protein